MSWVLDVGAILGGVAAVLAAWWSRKAKDAAATAATNAETAAAQTNGPLRAQSAALADQGVVLELIQDGIRSLGHQVGEVRADMGRMDERLTAEVAQLRASRS